MPQTVNKDISGYPEQPGAEFAVVLIFRQFGNDPLPSLGKDLIGFGTIVSNVNLPNRGQSGVLPMGSIVESNCLFTANALSPVISTNPTGGAFELIKRASDNIDTLCRGIREKDMDMIFSAFCSQGLCKGLSQEDARSLFGEMIEGTKEYLIDYFGEERLAF